MKTLSLVFPALLFFACQNSNQSAPKQLHYSDIDRAASMEAEEAIDSLLPQEEIVLYNIFSINEIQHMINDNTLPTFNEELLHDTHAWEKYMQTYKIALNFGIYTADLSYLWIYGQNQQALSLIMILEKMSKSLSIPDGFIDFTISSLEHTMNNTDTMLQILNDAFLATNKHLKKNQEDKTALFIVLGTYIETLYLACEMHSAQKDAFAEKIIAQVFPVNVLHNWCKRYPNDLVVAQYAFALENMKEAYKKLIPILERQMIEIDTFSGNCIVKSGKIDLKPEDVSEIRSLVADFRNQIISD